MLLHHDNVDPTDSTLIDIAEMHLQEVLLSEPAEIAAAHEVEDEEEMHLSCQEMHLLGFFRTDVNRGMGWVNSYLADHFTPIVC